MNAVPLLEELPAPVGWTVRPTQPGDEPNLADLYERVVGRPRTPAAWQWKFGRRSAPFPLYWVAVAEADGRIIGQYAGFPLHLKLGDLILPIVHSVEALTDPTYRRQGILTRLIITAHTAWAAAGQHAVLGLPNDKWGSRTSALGWVNLFPLAWLRFPLHLGRTLAGRAGLPGPLRGPAGVAGTVASALWRGATVGRQGPGHGADLTIEPVEGPSPAFDQLWERVAPAYRNCDVRDSAWVAWRYGGTGGPAYRVLLAQGPEGPRGYVAYRCYEGAPGGTALLADLFCAPTDQAGAAALVRAALDDLGAQGAGLVRAAAPPDSALHGLLRGVGFRPQPQAFGVQIVPLSPAVDPAALSDPRTWHLSVGDADVV